MKRRGFLAGLLAAPFAVVAAKEALTDISMQPTVEVVPYKGKGLTHLMGKAEVGLGEVNNIDEHPQYITVNGHRHTLSPADREAYRSLFETYNTLHTEFT